MGANKAISGTYTEDTETDLYTNTSDTVFAISLKLSAYNQDISGHAIEIWVTDESDLHQECLFNGVLSAGTLITDGSKTLIPPGHKIRFLSDYHSVTFTAHIIEGLA